MAGDHQTQSIDMGIYDRDYYRSEEPGYHVSVASWTWTTKIVFINVGVYVVQLLTKQSGWFSDTFMLHADWWTRPWLCFELLTYGFLHSTGYFWHIVFNMLVLWFFGRELEARYSRKEYLTFYLTAIVVTGLVWSASQYFIWGNYLASSWGASGGVTAIVILFAFHFPRREVLLWFVIPMPIWVLALIWVGVDMFGAVYHPGNVGYEAHLGGAAFAAAYYLFGWRLSRFLPGRIVAPSLKRRPKLRVHRPEPAQDEGLEVKVDEILRKIQENGLDSLTRKERQILEQAGQEYKRRRH